VSIGGWCGPALMLGKLGLRTEAYPFDFSRCTLDGIAQFTRHGFRDGFFPPGPLPYRPECVGIWVLYRGQHTAFAHFDLNSPAVQEAFERKFARWDALLEDRDGTSALDNPARRPIVFLRTVTARDPRDELAHVASFEAAVEERNPNLDFRIALMVHDQGLVKVSSRTSALDQHNAGLASSTQDISVPGGFAAMCVSAAQVAPAPATLLEPMTQRTAVWAVEYTCDATNTLFDRAQSGYSAVVDACVDAIGEGKPWPLRPSTMTDGGVFPLRPKGLSLNSPRRSAATPASAEDRDANQATSSDFSSTRAAAAAFLAKQTDAATAGSAHNVDGGANRSPSAQVELEVVPTLDPRAFPWRCHDNIALIDGTASVAGTCTGANSTSALRLVVEDVEPKEEEEDASAHAADGACHVRNADDTAHASRPLRRRQRVVLVCAVCGDRTGHSRAMSHPAGTEEPPRPWTAEEDELVVAHLCRMLVLAGDRVESVEALASELGRGAWDVVCRMRHLTDNSTKITDGMDLAFLEAPRESHE
jgi:hypothetical protein